MRSLMKPFDENLHLSSVVLSQNDGMESNPVSNYKLLLES